MSDWCHVLSALGILGAQRHVNIHAWVINCELDYLLWRVGDPVTHVMHVFFSTPVHICLFGNLLFNIFSVRFCLFDILFILAFL
jgi:hypothetical protein